MFQVLRISAKFRGSADPGVRYATICSLMAFIVGAWAWSYPIAAEHIPFFLSAPPAGYVASRLCWRGFRAMRISFPETGIMTGLFTALLAQYFNFALLGAGYWLLDVASGSPREAPLWERLTWIAALQTAVSLWYTGLATISATIFAALYVETNDAVLQA